MMTRMTGRAGEDKGGFYLNCFWASISKRLAQASTKKKYQNLEHMDSRTITEKEENLYFEI